ARGGAVAGRAVGRRLLQLPRPRARAVGQQPSTLSPRCPPLSSGAVPLGRARPRAPHGGRCDAVRPERPPAAAFVAGEAVRARSPFLPALPVSAERDASPPYDRGAGYRELAPRQIGRASCRGRVRRSLARLP